MRAPTTAPFELAAWIRKLIRENKIYVFYKTNDWLELRDEVLRDAHYECQHCLKQGRYTRATMVHHINEVRKRPDMALTKEYIDKATGEKKKNLVALCFDCHEKEHDRFAEYHDEQMKGRFQNEERW